MYQPSLLRIHKILVGFILFCGCVYIGTLFTALPLLQRLSLMSIGILGVVLGFLRIRQAVDDPMERPDLRVLFVLIQLCSYSSLGMAFIRVIIPDASWTAPWVIATLLACLPLYGIAAYAYHYGAPLGMTLRQPMIVGLLIAFSFLCVLIFLPVLIT
jgi:hypothetical protein